MSSLPPSSSPTHSSPTLANADSNSLSRQANKRAFGALSDALEFEAVRKKHRGDMGQDPTAPFRHAARWVGRAIDPFVRLQDAFHVGGVYDWVEAETDEGREVPLPNDDVIMSIAIGQSRSDDIGTLKTHGLDIIEMFGLMDHKKIEWAAKKISYKVKAIRGFNDIIFGRLLCPHKLSKAFKEDPHGLCKKITEGCADTVILASDLPAFLYDRDYNPNAIDEGLLRGQVPVQIYKCIFTSPSSVALVGIGSNTKGRSSHAQLHGLTRVTPHTIAYACMLMDPDSDWTVGTLDWWDK
ncbi:hypothetical protein PHLCEN_2v8381 [Hermanssonia centrifuga]|uniref:Uncharacterized protein n=1 Tax=Hermanssonia centrifuga TaxID=98765 RepID=A0A2R6NTU1_9APHY|nr:hypothetical protein PHLCEN_2v8381 [Hermanssonia centrifuga]